jgi:pimeloyl-ACP methyl ester carboxylesterase
MFSQFSINYQTTGDPNHPCIILIMGIGGQLIHWPDSFCNSLADSGYYVVRFDNRDAGLSKHYDEIASSEIGDAIKCLQAGKTFDPPYKLENMASDVVALMDELTIPKAHIVGISMGGMIAQLVAANYANRVLSLICLATSSGEPTLPPAKPEVMNFFFSPKRKSENMSDYVDDKVALYKIYNHPDYFVEQEVRELHENAYKRDHNAGGFKRQLLAMLVAKPRTEVLKQLDVPTLIIHGDYDPVFSVDHGTQLSAAIKNSSLVVMPKLGHGLPNQLGIEIANLITQFIQNIPVKRGMYENKF